MSRLPDEPEDRWLRDTLAGAVDDVRPADGLSAIRSRTRRPSRAHGWTWGLGGALVGTTATALVVTVLTAGSADRTQAPLPEAAGPVGETVAAPAYFSGETGAGPRLFREFYRVPAGDDVAVSAVNLALSTTPTDPDYTNPWVPFGVVATDVTSSPTEITVSLEGPGSATQAPGELTADQAALAVQQLVFTVQGALQSGNRVPVRFLLGGQPTASLLGVLANRPIEAGDPLDVQAPVWVTQPFEGATVPVGYEVRGRGAFFEGTVSWQLLRDDTVVAADFTTTECCRLAPYAFTIPDVPDGAYTLRVFAEDASGGEGFGEFEDTKQITIESTGPSVGTEE